MEKNGKRVIVGMSGGVDSSVAALLLKNEGYDVIGVFMKNWEEENEEGFCSAENDFSDVRGVADIIGIPYYTANFSQEYLDNVFSHFISDYKKGRTPNPDVLCNREIKFGYFQNLAKQLNADFLATGHYAGILKRDGRTYLTRAKDENKDQTYFLNQVSEKQIENVIFPLQNIDKTEVRRIAKENALPVWKKKDSTGICFIGERKFRDFLKNYLPAKEGEIKTLDGETIGTHAGVCYYTIGQRKGFGIGGGGNGKPWFIIRKDVEKNILYVSQGEVEELFKKELITEDFNYITERLIAPTRVLARIRHREPLHYATAIPEENRIRLIFDKPERAIVEGQYAVIYSDTPEKICIGGAAIDKVL